MVFMEFVDIVRTCKFGFNEIIAKVVDLYNKILVDINITELMGVLNGYLDYIKPALPFILLAVYLTVALAGKRLFAVIRFLSFFGAGFFLGVYSLSPIVLDVMPNLPTWVIGIVTGTVAAVLAKFIYFVVLAVAAAYSTYIVCYMGMIPWVGALMKENWIIALVIAALVTVALFFLLKYFEMLGTAMLGSFGIACVVRDFYDYAALEMFVGREWLALLIVTLTLGAISFFVQFKTRERYN